MAKWRPKQLEYSGWRIDHVLVAPILASRITFSGYLKKVDGHVLVHLSDRPQGGAGPTALSNHAAMVAEIQM